MKKALIIIAQDGYQDLEFAGTRDGLEGAGFQVVVCSKEEGECRGSMGGTEIANIALRDVCVSDYDRIAFVGGPGMAAYPDDKDALQVAKDAANADMPLGAICIAPTVFARAGVLRGKKATVWDADGVQKTLLEEHDAIYTGDDVTVDENIVTANGPHAAEEFGTILASLYC